MIFKTPNDNNIIPLQKGITWLYFLNLSNFFIFSVVIPTTIKGVTWPNPKKNKNIIEIKGVFACETHASKVASTGVMHGEDASPNVAPVTKGARNGGIFS